VRICIVLSVVVSYWLRMVALCWFREQGESKMPVLFTLSHPLDEIAPVICKTGGIHCTWSNRLQN